MINKQLMQRAIDLAKENVAQGGWPFSSVIARDGVILSEGVNTVATTFDPSNHAEIAAIRAATKKLQTTDLSGSTLFVVGLPCPMCLTCSIYANIKSIVYAVDVAHKDEALSELPLTDGLYDLISKDYGAAVISYQQLREFEHAGTELFAAWNETQK